MAVSESPAETSVRRRGPSRAFTLVDVLVTMAVVALLIAMLLPSLSTVRESARRVVCSSNLRQVGLGLALYADSSRDRLPYSVFIDARWQTDEQLRSSPANMMTLRLPYELSERTDTTWDGLGLLYDTEVLPDSEIFYCPSHHGDHRFSATQDRWLRPAGEIVGNYHYRGQGPNRQTKLTSIEPSRAAMAADGLRTLEDYNHRVGLNVLRADLSLLWVSDPTGRIGEFLTRWDDASGELDFGKLWLQLDNPDEKIIPDD